MMENDPNGTGQPEQPVEHKPVSGKTVELWERNTPQVFRTERMWDTEGTQFASILSKHEIEKLRFVRFQLQQEITKAREKHEVA